MVDHAIGVLGAGTMGSNIVPLCTQHDMDIMLRDIDADLVSVGLDRID